MTDVRGIGRAAYPAGGDAPPDRRRAQRGREAPQQHGVELQSLGLADGEYQLAAQRGAQPVALPFGAHQHHLARPAAADRFQEVGFGDAIDQQGRPAAERPAFGDLAAGQPDQRAFQQQHLVGQADDVAHAAEVDAEVDHRRYRQAALVVARAHLLPAEAARVDDLLGVAGEHGTARIAGQAEQQGELHVGEVLHLVTHHQVIAEPVAVPLQVLQRGACLVDLVVARVRLQPRLVVLGEAMDVAPVEREVGCALAAQALVLAQGQQRLFQARGLLLQESRRRFEQEQQLVAAQRRRVPQAGGELLQRPERGLARPHAVEPCARLQVGEPHHVLRQLDAFAQRSLSGREARRQLREPAPAHRRLGALDDGADLLPHQLRVVAGGAGVVAEDGAELGQPGRRRLPLGAPGVAQDFTQQLAQSREAHRLGRMLQLGGLHQPAVDALGKPLQVRAAGEEQRPLGARRIAPYPGVRSVGERSLGGGPGGACPPRRGRGGRATPGSRHGRAVRRVVRRCAAPAAVGVHRSHAPVGRRGRRLGRRGEPAHPVAQQEVDRDGGLAAARGAGQQQRRLTVQQPRLIAGQEQVHLEVVAVLRGQQAAPLLLVHHQPALRAGVARRLAERLAVSGRAAPAPRYGDRLVECRREVVAAQVVGDELRQLLDQGRLEVQERCVGRHDAALGGGGHVIVLDYPPHVDAGDAGGGPGPGGPRAARSFAVRRFAEREQDAVAAAEARLEHRAPAALQLLDTHPGVPQARLQELQFLAQTLPGTAVQGHHVGAYRVVQQEGVVAWHGVDESCRLYLASTVSFTCASRHATG